MQTTKTQSTNVVPLLNKNTTPILPLSIILLAKNLRTWEPVPASMEQQLREALPIVQSALTPAEPEHFKQAIGWLMKFGATFGLKMENAEETLVIYQEALGDLPPDLLSRAIKAMFRTHTDTFRLPMPSTIRQYVAEDLSERRQTLHSIEAVLWKIDLDRKHSQKRAEKTQNEIPSFADDRDVAQETSDNNNDAAARRAEMKKRIKAVMAETTARMSVNKYAAGEEHTP